LKAYTHFSSSLITLIAIVFYLAGLTLRFIPNNTACFQAARVILSIDVILWYFLQLNAYCSVEALGPLFVLMERIARKLLYFLLVLVLVIFAFGVATQSLMYPNQRLDADLLKKVFFPTFFFLGHEHYTRHEIMNSATCSPDAGTRCPDQLGASVSLALYVVYLIAINLFLTNLLIAILKYK